MKVGVGGVASLMWSYLSSKRKISSRSHSVYFLGWSNQGHMATLGQLIDPLPRWDSGGAVRDGKRDLEMEPAEPG